MEYSISLVQGVLDFPNYVYLGSLSHNVEPQAVHTSPFSQHSVHTIFK
jgi:hypothetical protein